jgi:chromosome partitioning protein
MYTMYGLLPVRCLGRLHSRHTRPLMGAVGSPCPLGTLQGGNTAGMANRAPMVCTLVQWKGGVGKSTLAIHMAAALDAVLVDLEPWGGATAWWAGPRAAALWQAPGRAPLLRALSDGSVPRPRRGSAGRPRLVPSHEQLLGLGEGAIVATAEGPRPLAEAIRQALPRWAEAWGCHVVVDTPAGFGPLADGAVAAADVVVLPVTLDQWAVPALRKFMASYAGRVRCGLVVPNRVRRRLEDRRWAELVTADGLIPAPFVLGPPVAESEVLHAARRPLTAGPVPSPARGAAIAEIDALARRTLELAA